MSSLESWLWEASAQTSVSTAPWTTSQLLRIVPSGILDEIHPINRHFAIEFSILIHDMDAKFLDLGTESGAGCFN